MVGVEVHCVIELLARVLRVINNYTHNNCAGRPFGHASGVLGTGQSYRARPRGAFAFIWLVGSM